MEYCMLYDWITIDKACMWELFVMASDHLVCVFFCLWQIPRLAFHLYKINYVSCEYYPFEDRGCSNIEKTNVLVMTEW